MPLPGGHPRAAVNTPIGVTRQHLLLLLLLLLSEEVVIHHLCIALRRACSRAHATISLLTGRPSSSSSSSTGTIPSTIAFIFRLSAHVHRLAVVRDLMPHRVARTNTLCTKALCTPSSFQTVMYSHRNFVAETTKQPQLGSDFLYARCLVPAVEVRAAGVAVSGSGALAVRAARGSPDRIAAYNRL